MLPCASDRQVALITQRGLLVKEKECHSKHLKIQNWAILAERP
jgi:hypothetical protein